MTTWRAKRYRLQINRRHRVAITVRRFRRTSRPKAGKYSFNLHLGSLRQLVIEHQTIGRRGRSRTAQRPTVSRWQTALTTLLITGGLIGITLSTAALTRPKVVAPTQTYKTVQAKVASPLSLPGSAPTHLTISDQQIDTDLIPVGLDANGAIELPPVLDWVAGWYKYSPTPGEIGPAVIVGHLDSYENISVFWRLRDVQPGAIIEVTRTDGRVARFKVTQLAQYDQNNFPTDIVYGDTANAELRLITCGGTFDNATGHYSQNTVVYATLVS